MKTSGKKYDAKYKAKVAIEAIKERETLSDSPPRMTYSR